MAYTSSTLVIAWLGSNYDAVNDLTSGQVDAHITKADAVIDGELSAKYYKFNAYGSTKTDGTDTYVTPGPVALASMHLATGFAFAQLRALANNSVLLDSAQYHTDQGWFYLNRLRDPQYRLPVNTWRNYTLTFGDSSPEQQWELQENEAFISPTALDSGDPPNILDDTVRIGSTTTTARTDVSAADLLSARLGVEYSVRWDRGYQRYVLTAHDVKLYENTTLKVTFDWDYRRDRGRESHLSGVILVG